MSDSCRMITLLPSFLPRMPLRGYYSTLRRFQLTLNLFDIVSNKQLSLKVKQVVVGDRMQKDSMVITLRPRLGAVRGAACIQRRCSNWEVGRQ